MSDQPGIAVFGCGYWGKNYVRVFSELSQAHIRIVCDQQPERLRTIGQHFPDVGLTTDPAEAIETDAVDAAIICTPASTHYDLIKQCLQAGKHVLVEKPLTTCSALASEVVELAAACGKTLMVGHTFLYNDSLQEVKSTIARGQIGTPYYFYSRRTNLGPIRHDVNALWDLTPHDISIFNFLLDDTPAWVSAVGVQALQNGNEDAGFVTLGYRNGIVAHNHVSWIDPHKVRELIVVGSKARIVFDDLNAVEPVRIFEKGVAVETNGNRHLKFRDGNIVSAQFKNAEPLKNQCQHFLNCITHGTVPLTCGQSGWAVVRIIEAINCSMSQNGKPIQLEGMDQCQPSTQQFPI